MCSAGHLDMVTEKNADVSHDFFKDPLRLQLAGEWLKARPACEKGLLQCAVGRIELSSSGHCIRFC